MTNIFLIGTINDLLANLVVYLQNSQIRCIKSAIRNEINHPNKLITTIIVQIQ